MTVSYEFNQWGIVFRLWRGFTKQEKEAHQMVISRNFYTSGYWIEPKGTKVSYEDHAYTGEEVDNLMKRVEVEIETAEKEERAPNLTI